MNRPSSVYPLTSLSLSLIQGKRSCNQSSETVSFFTINNQSKTATTTKAQICISDYATKAAFESMRRHQTLFH
jgi:hypothetical protein